MKVWKKGRNERKEQTKLKIGKKGRKLCYLFCFREGRTGEWELPNEKLK
jgi:hypothetical protein